MMDKNPLWYRSRGLKEMEERFGNNLIQKFIAKKFRTENNVRVLELGCGEGKCLIDLKNKFARAELYGVNDVEKGNMNSDSDFYSNAKEFGTPISKDNLPRIHFFDAGKGLKFDDNTFDAVISQVSFQYVDNKAFLIEEFWRVLKPGGKAFIQIDSPPEKNSPDFMKINLETPKFVIYESDKMVRTSEYFRRIKKKGFDVTIKQASNKPSHTILLMNKNRTGKLDLKLEFDGNSTLNLTKLKNSDDHKTEGSVWWGTRSVFKTTTRTR